MFRRATLAVCLVVVGLGCLFATCAQAEENTPRRPNVIVILVDDFGYECVGANGGTSYRTPVLDRMAIGGTRFTNCYVQPLCTPTRVQLMTGLYNVRNYTQFAEMDPNATTFANLFQNAGYATCMAGKWQLGHDLEKPKKYGFDEYCLWQHMRRPSRYKNPGLEINGKEVDYRDGEYGPDVVNRYALDFIERKKGEPFLLYYSMMLTHGPYDPTPDSPDYAEGAAPKQKKAANNKKKNKKKARNAPVANRHFADMVEYMDKLVGRVQTKLEELGIADNTMIVFLGDNGTGKGIRSKMGDRVVDGGKGNLNASGMHVPLLVRWPDRIARGKVCKDLIDSTDILPTICAAAGVEVPDELNVDGHSFLPQLRGEIGKPRKWYYSWYAPRAQLLGEFAATERYKLYRDGRFFDLTSDPEESQPLERKELQGDAAAAAKTLQGALDQYKDARPANLSL